jgi:hypothetical protein
VRFDQDLRTLALGERVKLSVARAKFGLGFGMQTPIINSLIVSADTDNTGERAESYFGDAEFRALRLS